MKFYQIKDLCELTSVTARTLQYYDDIGLLNPTKRSHAGYRLYSQDDLVRLQKIITLKFLGISLTEIKHILNTSEVEPLKCFQHQIETLIEKANRFYEAAKLLKYIAAQLNAEQTINWESTANIISVLEMKTMNDTLTTSELGKKSAYISHYSPELLYPIPRAGKRREIGIDPDNIPFHGLDIWNHYEVSWLNTKGKPMVAIAEISYDCKSVNIIESKSMKLYFNSFNNSQFESKLALENIIKIDLEKNLNSAVNIKLYELNQFPQTTELSMPGINLDTLDIDCNDYLVNSNLLKTENEYITESLHSNLLKSNCLVTNQPDWGSVLIEYKGNKINHESLLKYIVSFRNHNEFHEQCIERIFVDIMTYCKPDELTVYGRYTRRGGLDINPIRSTKQIDFNKLNYRLVRQ